MFRPTYAEIDLQKLSRNLQILRKMSGEKNFFCPMLKAQAYGHGDIEIGRWLCTQGVSAFGFVMVEEGIRLRQAGVVNLPFLIFGFFDKAAAEAVLENHLLPVVSAWPDLELLAQAASRHSRRLEIHLKFDTGMHRLGFALKDAEQLQSWLKEHPELVLTGLCSHLLQGEDLGQKDGRTDAQLKLFKELCQKFSQPNLICHIYNSACLVNHSVLQPKTLPTWGARPGLSLYGLYYGRDYLEYGCQFFRHQLGLQPIAKLMTRLSLVRQITAGESVSYNQTWRAQRDSWIGLVPVGYADGYWRRLSNLGEMLFRGIRVPVIGIVCMDYTMLDLTDVAREGVPQIGEEVVVFGQQKDQELAAEELAQKAGTVAYELLTNLGGRVPRTYINGQHIQTRMLA